MGAPAALGVAIISSVAAAAIIDYLNPPLSKDPELPQEPDPPDINNNFDFSNTNTHNVNNYNTYNFNPPSLTPPPSVVYVPTGNGARPEVSIEIKDPPEVPNRRLPKEADGQTDTKTPKKRSISIKQQLTEKPYGGLLTHPVSTKPIKRYNLQLSKFKEQLTAAKEDSVRKFANWMTLQQAQPANQEEKKEYDELAKDLTLWDSFALVAPASIPGLSGEIGLLYGMKPLAVLASAYNVSRANAYQEVTGYVPLKLTVGNKPIADSTPTTLGDQKLQISTDGEIRKVLGVDDFSWALTASPEDILKGYGLLQFAKNGESEEFSKQVKAALESGNVKQFIEGISGTTDGNKLQIKSLPRLMALMSAAAFFRAGYHRLPQEYPEHLVKDKAGLTTGKKGGTPPPPKLIKLGDMLEIQDWQNRQLDALFGEWATTIKVKSPDGKKEEEIHLPNMAEAIGELFNLVFNINLLSEHQTQMQIKALSELIKLFNQDLLTHDHVVAISKFLGYNGETDSEEVPLPFNPKADDLMEFQQPSKHNVLRWKNVDKAVMKEDLITVGLNAAKAASAVWRKYKPGEPLPGEKIKQKREEAKKLADEQWDKWIKENNLPTGYEKLDQKPRPIIDNIPVSDNQDDA
ncbi:hypothetical protein [Synechocystis sp. LKSZ1]|uniref:hypothetical protein n=1 Tax=Synechocystis sp. LKSZ1 TaxID=3144951 RepID=UPI00336C2B6A